MEEIKGKLGIIEAHEHLTVEHEDAKHSLTKIAIFYRPTEKEKVIATHLVECWTEYDSLKKKADSHDELLDALEAADLALNICAKYLLNTGPIPEPEGTALTIIQIKQAIANAEGDD